MYADQELLTDADALRDYVSENRRYPISPDDWPHVLANADTQALEAMRAAVREVKPRNQIRGFYDDVAAELAEERQDFLDCLDTQLAHRGFPDHPEWPVDPGVVEDVAEYPIFTKPLKNEDIAVGFEEWAQLYDERSADELAFISDAVRVGLTPQAVTFDATTVTTSPDRADIVEGLQYYKPDAEVELTDLIRLTRRGDGASYDVAKASAAQVFDSLHPVVGAHLMARTPEIKTNTSSNNKYIRTSYDNPDENRAVNLSFERGQYREDRCSAALVFGWSLCDMLDVISRSPENGETPRDEWGPYFHRDINNVSERPDRSRETTPRWASLHERLTAIDEAFRAGEFDPVHDRQMRRGKDLLAYGFELWIANPNKAQVEQEPLAEFFHDYLQRDALAARVP